MGQGCAGTASPPDATPVRHPAEVPVLGKVYLGAPLSLSVLGGDIKPWCQCPGGQGGSAVLCSQRPAGSEGPAGSYPGASGSGKFIKAAELLMVLDVHQDWRSYFNYFT